MASIREIKDHIESVKDMEKITGAMYLIASVKLRRAKEKLYGTRPYFDAVLNEIKRIFRVSEDVESRYFYPATGEHDIKGAYGYLVITANKGLAGSYNQNVIKETMRLMDKNAGHENKLFVVGEYGRQFFKNHKVPIEESFLHTAEEVYMGRARKIADTLLERYNSGELKKIYVIYTDFSNGLSSNTKVMRLLPFHRRDFTTPIDEKPVEEPFEFVPSLTSVLDSMMPGYLTGLIYSVLVDSYCSEQNARLSAMSTANDNAKEILSDLRLDYNHERQGAITQEITEISAGSRVQKKRGNSK